MTFLGKYDIEGSNVQVRYSRHDLGMGVGIVKWRFAAGEGGWSIEDYRIKNYPNKSSYLPVS